MSDRSPIGDFYPQNFVTDKNGKQHDWEAVVLIPFIEEVSFQSNSDSLHRKNKCSEF